MVIDGTRPLESQIYSPHCFIGKKNRRKQNRLHLYFIVLLCVLAAVGLTGTTRGVLWA